MSVSCREHIANITEDVSPYKLLFYLNPGESPLWESTTSAWQHAYLAFTATYSVLYLTVAVIAVALTVKNDCLRLKTKTFFAIYFCITVSSTSRFLLLALDPYGVVGWLRRDFEQWTIISRFLSILGLPSLISSCTLVFLILYKSIEMGSSRLWARGWHTVLPVVTVPYLAAVTVEIIGNTATYPALVSVVACDAGFTLWGILICIAYLATGRRLIRRLEGRCNDGPSSTDAKERWRTNLTTANKTYDRRCKISRTVRKVAVITYFTAAIGLLYMVVNATSLFFTSWFLFVNCLGLRGVGDPYIWLGQQVAGRTLEIPLMLVLVYSVTNIGGLCCSKLHKLSCEDGIARCTQRLIARCI